MEKQLVWSLLKMAAPRKTMSHKALAFQASRRAGKMWKGPLKGPETDLLLQEAAANVHKQEPKGFIGAVSSSKRQLPGSGCLSPVPCAIKNVKDLWS